MAKNNKIKQEKQSKRAVNYVAEHYFISPGDFERQGISRQYAYRLEQLGVIEKYCYGIYTSKLIKEEPPYASFILTCKKIPKGIICLLSALEYHDISTQVPQQVWICTSYNCVTPRGFPYRLSMVKASDVALGCGVIEEIISGNVLRVTNPAKTIADCFKFRNKIGIHVAIEALKDGLSKRKFTVDEVIKYAKFNKVHNVIEPYIESITNE